MYDKIDPPAQYWAAVHELLGSDPKQASTAIGLNADQLRGFTPQGLLRPLLAALDGSFWRVPKSTTARNWTWRHGVPKSNGTEDSEVQLERCIAELGADRWCCQMPTLSGYFGPRRYKRRSVDLVHELAPGHYRFIELKVRSDNPLYAAFEVLSYGLTYLLARRYGPVQSDSQYKVLRAEVCELVVLGPSAWYGRFSQEQRSLLTSLLDQALDHALAESNDTGLKRMTFQFMEFPAVAKVSANAEHIVRMLSAGHLEAC